jgi:protein transport protein SEC31
VTWPGLAWPDLTIYGAANEWKSKQHSNLWHFSHHSLFLFFFSTGKDNRTILWDLFTLKPIADVPNDAVSLQESTNSGSDAMFAAGGLASSQQRRYDVQWSPIKRGVASTCSLDRKVQAHSILGLSGKSGRPPKWLRPSSSVSFGFGGSVVSCGSENKIVSLSTVVEQPQLQQVSDTFEGTIESTNVVDFCKDLAYKARDPGEAQLWGFMQVIFETNARQELLDHLGFDPTAIANAAAAYKEDTTSNGVESMSLKDQPPNVGMSKPAEEMVKKALLVGNFEAAVDCCFRIGNLADALVLASCGGADLWAKTQARYFKVESSKRPFLSIVSAIIHTQLEELVRCSNPKKWQETLAILSTYGKSDEFPTLCIALGDLLETSGDPRSASLCYMCALSLDEAVKFWRAQLDLANKEKQTDGMDLLALHEFVVKVSVFLKAAGPSAVLDPKDADLFSKYAEKLSEQGLLVAAAKYCKGEGEDSRILRDRLYRSKASPACLAAMGGSPPEFPFTLANIQQSRGQTSGAETRKNQQQQAAAAIQQQEVAAAAAAAIHQNNQNTSQQSNTPQNYTRQESSNSATSANGQQSQYNQQQQYGQHTAAQTAQPTQAAPDALPAGWVALQDPSSGSMYYANQATGEVTWEKPQDAPQPAYAPAPAPQPVEQPAASTNGTSSSSTPNRMASKYGDGFVTSASHPELANQYGNVGTR